MSLSDKLANLPIPWVLGIVAALLVLRFVLLKQRMPAAKSIAEIAESLAVAMALVFLLIRPFIIQAFYIPSASMRPTLLESDHILVNKFIYRFTDPKTGDVVVFKSPPAADADEKDFIKRVVGVPGDTVRITPGYVLIGGSQYNHEALHSMLGVNMDGKIKLVNGKVVVDGKSISLRKVAVAAQQPGSKVKVFPGKVYVNGKPLNESYTAEDPDKPYPGAEMTHDKSDIVILKDNRELAVKIPKGKVLVMGDNRNNSLDARYWGLLDRSRMLGKAMFIFWPLNRMSWIR